MWDDGSSSGSAPSFSTDSVTVWTTNGVTVTNIQAASGSPTPGYSASCTSGGAGAGTYAVDGSGKFTFTPSASGEYGFSVTATNSAGTNSYTITAKVIPKAPSLSLEQGSDASKMVVTVGDVETGSTLDIRRYEDSGTMTGDTSWTAGTSLASLVTGNGDFTDTGLDGCKTYYYRIRQSKGGFTSATNTADLGTSSVLAPSVTATPGDSEIGLKWGVVAGATNYLVEVATNETFSTGGGGTATDNLSGDVAGSGYAEWTTNNCTSGASYAGFAMKASSTYSNSIQMNNDKGRTCGLAATASPGTAASITVTWYGGSKSVEVYGSFTAYASYTNLYDSSTRGTLITTIASSSTGTSIDLTNGGTTNYPYIGLKPAESGAIYVDVDITWNKSGGGGAASMLDGYPVLSGGGAVTNYTATGLTNGVTYHYRVTALGGGSCTAASTGSATPEGSGAPELGVSPNPLAFGNVAVDGTSTLEVTVTNSGTATLSVTAVATNGTHQAYFSADKTSFTVAAGSSTTIAVTYNPRAAGSHTAGLVLTHNAEGSPTTVNLTGTGTVGPGLTVAPASLSLASTNPAAGSAGTFTVSGTNLAAGVTVTVESGPFEVSTDGSSWDDEVTIPASGTLGDTTVYVHLAADASVGPQTGSLSVTSGSAEEKTVGLTGTVHLARPEVTVQDGGNSELHLGWRAVPGATNYIVSVCPVDDPAPGGAGRGGWDGGESGVSARAQDKGTRAAYEGTFTKIEAVDFTEGYYVFVASNTVAMNKAFTNTTVTVTDGRTISNPDTTIVWQAIAGTGDYAGKFLLKSVSEGTCVNWPSSTTVGLVAEGSAGTRTYWAPYWDPTNNWWVIVNNADSTRAVCYRATEVWKCYSSGNWSGDEYFMPQIFRLGGGGGGAGCLYDSYSLGNVTNLVLTAETDPAVAAGTNYSWSVTAQYEGTISETTNGQTRVSAAAPTLTLVEGSGLTEMSTPEGTPSAAGTFTVSGGNLAENVTLTAPTGFELCLTAGGTYANSIEIPASGTLSATTVYVRLSAGASPGSYGGTITAASGEATVSGTVTVGGSVTTAPGTAANGVQFPGDWNDWATSYTTSQDSNFGGGSFYYTPPLHLTGDQLFKALIAPNSWYGNGDWLTGNIADQVKTVNVNWDSNGELHLCVTNTTAAFSPTGAGYYTLRGKADGGGVRYAAMYTTNAPIGLTGASDDSATAGLRAVTVTATLSGEPSGEIVYVRYTTDNWTHSYMVPMTVDGTTATGTIPAAAAGLTVQWYVMTSPHAAATAEPDLCLLRGLKSGSTNFAYVAGATAPTLADATSADVTAGSATLGGTVTGEGGADLTGGGVVFSATSLNGTPTVGGSGCTNVALAVAPTNGVAFTVSVTGLLGCTEYTYRAYAVNAAGLTGYSTNGTFTTDRVGTPVVSSTNNSSETAFTIGWEETAGAAGYELQVTTGSGGGAGGIAGTYTLVTSTNDLSSGNYVIAALASETYHAMTNVAISNFIKEAAIDAAKVGNSGTTLSITNDADEGIVWYLENHDTYWTIKNGDQYAIWPEPSGNSNYADMGADGTVAKAHWSLTYDSDAGGWDVNNQSTAGNGRTHLRYNSSAPRFACYNSGQTIIRLYKQSGGGGGGGGSTVLSKTDIGSVTNYTVSGLTAGTTYAYSLWAYGGGSSCESETPATGSVRTAGVLVPTAPTLGVTTNNAGSLQVGVSRGNGEHYVLYRFVDAGEASSATTPSEAALKPTATLLGGSLTAASVEDSGLTGCRTYYYRAWEANTDGESVAYSPASAVATGTTPAPPAPTGLTVTSTNSHGATLVWDAVAGATGGYSVDVWHFEGDGGEETATYTVTSTSAVSAGGTPPDGAGATYASTYGQAFQLTSGNSMTLTLSGYGGKRITGLLLSMRSNGSGGAGNLSMTDGDSVFASIATAAFNTASWNGAWSTNYVDIAVPVTAGEVAAGANLVITIAATANSLYCQSFSITYEGGMRIDDVEGNRTSDGSVAECTVTGTGATLAKLQDSRTYYWSVSGVGDCTGTAGSGPSFTTDELVGAPTITTPLVSGVESISGGGTCLDGATIHLRRYETAAGAAGDRTGTEGVSIDEKVTVDGTAWSFADTGLQGCKTYWYKAWQTATVGGETATGSGSNVASAQTGLAAPVMDPDPPVGAGTTLTLDWNAVPGAHWYNVVVANSNEFVEGTVGAAWMEENFNGFSSVSGSGTDIGTNLDTYTSIEGWNGAKVFKETMGDSTCAKIGTTSTNGWLVTPALNAEGTGGTRPLANGGTLEFDMKQYNTYSGSVSVQISYDGSNWEDLMDPFTTTTDVVTYSANLPATNVEYYLSWETQLRKPALLDNVKVIPKDAGSEGTIVYSVSNLTATAATVNGLETGKEYWWVVTAVSTNGCEETTTNSTVLLDVPMIQVKPTHPRPWDYGVVESGDTVTNKFTVKNTGSTDLTIKSIGLAGTGAAYYRIVGGGISGDLVLEAREEHEVYVAFAPESAGTWEATLALNCNAFNATSNVLHNTYEVYGVGLTGTCHDPRTEPPTVFWMKVDDDAGVENTVLDHSLAFGTADELETRTKGATLSVLAYHFNGMYDGEVAAYQPTWTLLNPDGGAVTNSAGVVLTNMPFDSAEAYGYDSKSCVLYTATNLVLGAGKAVPGDYTVLFTGFDSTHNRSVDHVAAYTPAEAGWLLENFTRADKFAGDDGALGNGWTAQNGNATNGEAAIYANGLELYGPHGEFSGKQGRIGAVRDMADRAYGKNLAHLGSTVSWGVHFRTGRGTTSFANGGSAGAFVLGMTESNLFSSAESQKGYAVTFTNNGVQLVEFSKGFVPSGTRTCLAEGSVETGKVVAVRVDFVPASFYHDAETDTDVEVPAKFRLYAAAVDDFGGNPLKECPASAKIGEVTVASVPDTDLRYMAMAWSHGTAKLSETSGCRFDDVYAPNEEGKGIPMSFHMVDEDGTGPEFYGFTLAGAHAAGGIYTNGLVVTGMVHDASGVWGKDAGAMRPQWALFVDDVQVATGTATNTPTGDGTGTDVALSMRIPEHAVANGTQTTNCVFRIWAWDHDRDHDGDSTGATNEVQFTLCEAEPVLPGWATAAPDGAEMGVVWWQETGGKYLVVRSGTAIPADAMPKQGITSLATGTNAVTLSSESLGTSMTADVMYLGPGEAHLAGLGWEAREFILEPGSENYFAVYGMSGDGTVGYYFSTPVFPYDYATNAVSGRPCEGTAREESWPVKTKTYGTGEGVDAFAYRMSVTYPTDGMSLTPAEMAMRFSDETRPETGHGWGGPWTGDTGAWKIHDGSLLTGDTQYPDAAANKLFWSEDTISTRTEVSLTRMFEQPTTGDVFVSAILNWEHAQGGGAAKWVTVGLVDENTNTVASFGNQGGSGDCAAIYVPEGVFDGSPHTLENTGSNASREMAHGHGQDWVVVGQLSRAGTTNTIRMWVYSAAAGSTDKMAEFFDLEENPDDLATAMRQVQASWEWIGTWTNAVAGVQLEAGSASGVSLGHVYIDEVRYSASWESLFNFDKPEVFDYQFGAEFGRDEEGRPLWRMSDGELAHGNVAWTNMSLTLFHRAGVDNAQLTLLDSEGNNVLMSAVDGDLAGSTPTWAELHRTNASPGAYTTWTSAVPNAAVATNLISLGDAEFTVQVKLESGGGRTNMVTSATALGGGGADDLFFGEYGNGQYWDKYVELYNGTGHDIDLSDYYLARAGSDSGGNYSNYSWVASCRITNGTYILHHHETVVVLSDSGDHTQEVNWTNRHEALEAALDSMRSKYLYLPRNNGTLDAGNTVPVVLFAKDVFEGPDVNGENRNSPTNKPWLDACGGSYDYNGDTVKEFFIMSRKEDVKPLPRQNLAVDWSEWDYRRWCTNKYDVGDDYQDGYEDFKSTAGVYDRNIGLGGTMKFKVYDDDTNAPTWHAGGVLVGTDTEFRETTYSDKEYVLGAWSFTNWPARADATTNDLTVEEYEYVAGMWPGGVTTNGHVSWSAEFGGRDLDGWKAMVEAGMGRGQSGGAFGNTAQGRRGDLVARVDASAFDSSDEVWLGFDLETVEAADRKLKFGYAGNSNGWANARVEWSATGEEGTFENPAGWSFSGRTGGATTWTNWEGDLETAGVENVSGHLWFRVVLSDYNAESGNGVFHLDNIQLAGRPGMVRVSDHELSEQGVTFAVNASDPSGLNAGADGAVADSAFAPGGAQAGTAHFDFGAGVATKYRTALLETNGAGTNSWIKWTAPNEAGTGARTGGFGRTITEEWYESTKEGKSWLHASLPDADDDRADDSLTLEKDFGLFQVYDDDEAAPELHEGGVLVGTGTEYVAPSDGDGIFVLGAWSFTNYPAGNPSVDSLVLTNYEWIAEMWPYGLTTNGNVTWAEELGGRDLAGWANVLYAGNNKGQSGGEFNGLVQRHYGAMQAQVDTNVFEPSDEVWLGFDLSAPAATDRVLSFAYAGGNAGFSNACVAWSTTGAEGSFTRPAGWSFCGITGGATTYEEWSGDLEEAGVPGNAGHLYFRVYLGEYQRYDGTFRLDNIQLEGTPVVVRVSDEQVCREGLTVKVRTSDPSKVAAGTSTKSPEAGTAEFDFEMGSTMYRDTSGVVEEGVSSSSVIKWTLADPASDAGLAAGTGFGGEVAQQWFTNSAAGLGRLHVVIPDQDDDRDGDAMALDGDLGMLSVYDDDDDAPTLKMQTMRPRMRGTLAEWKFTSTALEATRSFTGIDAGPLGARTTFGKETKPNPAAYDSATYSVYQSGWQQDTKFWTVTLEATTGSGFITNISFSAQVNSMLAPTGFEVKYVVGDTTNPVTATTVTCTTSGNPATAVTNAAGTLQPLVVGGAPWIKEGEGNTLIKTWRDYSVRLAGGGIPLTKDTPVEIRLQGMGGKTNGIGARWSLYDLAIQGEVEQELGEGETGENYTYVTDNQLRRGEASLDMQGYLWDTGSGLLGSGTNVPRYTLYRQDDSVLAEDVPLQFISGSFESPVAKALTTGMAKERADGMFHNELAIPTDYRLELGDFRGNVHAADADADRTNNAVNVDTSYLEGDFGFTVIDQDVVPPTAPTNVSVGGAIFQVTGSATNVSTDNGTTWTALAKETVVWTNNPEFLITFGEAVDVAPTLEQMSEAVKTDGTEEENYDWTGWVASNVVGSVDKPSLQLGASGVGEYRVAADTNAATLAGAPSFSAAATNGALGNGGFERYTAIAPWMCTGAGSGIVGTNTLVPPEGTNSFHLASGGVLYQVIGWVNGGSTVPPALAGSVKVYKEDGAASVKVLVEAAADESFAPVLASKEITLADGEAPAGEWLSRGFSANAAVEGEDPLPADLAGAEGACYLRISFSSEGGAAYLDDAKLENLTIGDAGTTALRYVADKFAQGLEVKYLFAVDADNDRVGDRLAGAPEVFCTAYDCTPPTAVLMDHKNGASTDSEDVDDPTTQMHLTWTSTGVGPDDPANENHPTKKSADKAILPPWKTYKIYYSAYDSEVAATNFSGTPGTLAYDRSVTNYFYQTFLAPGATGDGTQEEGKGRYTEWANVTVDSAIEDSTATTDYANLGNSATPGVKVYDLENDMEYVFVTVGVDQAGNEGPATSASWATNNTYKFALERAWHIPKTHATNLFTNIDLNAQLTNNTRTVSWLQWYAKGRTNDQGVIETTKEYDLIKWDARSFRESPNNKWELVGSVNADQYVDDGGPTNRGSIRFYRASYKDRWRRTVTNTSGQVTTQTPLVSVEVYAQTAVPLREGQNFVALHGVPYTNTLRAVFGGTNEFTGDSGEVHRTWITFYPPGETQLDRDQCDDVFWLNGNGIWRKKGDTATDWSDEPLDTNLFTRAFSIDLPTNFQHKVDTIVADGVTNTVTNTDFYLAGVQTNWHGKQPEEVPYMLWKPIVQVPTNGFGRVIKCGTTNAPKFNIVALRLPVATHPSKMNLIESGFTPGNPWNADQVYTINTLTREPGNSCYCADGTNWYFVSGGAVPGDYFKPNDVLVIVSKNPPFGDTESTNTSWTWEYNPADFYTLPHRHMQAE